MGHQGRKGEVDRKKRSCKVIKCEQKGWGNLSSTRAALLKAEIQNSRNRLDNMAQRQTRQCEYQAKQKEAKEYLRDKKGLSKFCSNTLSLQARRSWCKACP
jgi:ribosomal protein S18